jgi:HEAT repeat protein
MTTPGESELYPWNDPNDLLVALGRLRPEQKGVLGESVLQLLDHGDADVRQEAMRTLFVGWKAHGWRDRAISALTADESPEVRRTAAYGVAATTSDATRSRDTQQLLAVLENADEGLSVRGAAYDALLILYRKPAFPSLKRTFDPDRDVDWAWVRSLIGK